MLLEDVEPGRGRAGAEEVPGGARVDPGGQFPRLGRARAGERGQFEDPRGAAGQRHQQLPCQQQDFPVEAGGAGRVAGAAASGPTFLVVAAAGPTGQGPLLRTAGHQRPSAAAATSRPPPPAATTGDASCRAAPRP